MTKPKSRERVLPAMTSSSELLALAVRCEHEASSLALRCDIAKALGWQEVEYDCHIRMVDPDGKMWWTAQMPDPLTSIDAAVVLVPKDFDYMLTWYRKTADAYVSRDGGEFKPDSCVGQATASTLALALCAAALRARAKAGKEET